jgi:hypothetical protein
MQRYIVPTTFALLVAAFFSAIVWLFRSPDFEPAITCLTLITAITGLFIDRWLSEREHRRKLLQALAHELYMNLGVLKDVDMIRSKEGDTTPKMLPRFYNSTLSAVISSGTFTTENDATLWKLLHDWLQRSTEANVRFVTTEQFTFANPETTSLFYDILSSGQVMAQVRSALLDLTSHLLDAYARESGIDKETKLFFDQSSPKDTESVRDVQKRFGQSIS